MNKHQLHSLLSSDAIAGRIIRDFSELEWYMDLVLTRYFAVDERLFEFGDVVLSRISFNQKLEILSIMKLPRRMASQANAVKSLRKFRKLRNILAHSSFLSDKDLHELSSDNEIVSMLEEFPKSYVLEIGATKTRLNHLLRSHQMAAHKRKQGARNKDAQLR